MTQAQKSDHEFLPLIFLAVRIVDVAHRDRNRRVQSLSGGETR